MQQGVKKGEVRAAGMRGRDGLAKGLRPPLPGGLPRVLSTLHSAQVDVMITESCFSDRKPEGGVGDGLMSLTEKVDYLGRGQLQVASTPGKPRNECFFFFFNEPGAPAKRQVKGKEWPS